MYLSRKKSYYRKWWKASKIQLYIDSSILRWWYLYIIHIHEYFIPWCHCHTSMGMGKLISNHQDFMDICFRQQQESNWWCSPLSLFDLWPCTFSRVGIHATVKLRAVGISVLFIHLMPAGPAIPNGIQPTSILNIEWIQRRFSRSGAFGCMHAVGYTRDQFDIKDTQVYQHQSWSSSNIA